MPYHSQPCAGEALVARACEGRAGRACHSQRLPDPHTSQRCVKAVCTAGVLTVSATVLDTFAEVSACRCTVEAAATGLRVLVHGVRPGNCSYQALITPAAAEVWGACRPRVGAAVTLWYWLDEVALPLRRCSLCWQQWQPRSCWCPVGFLLARSTFKPTRCRGMCARYQHAYCINTAFIFA